MLLHNALDQFAEFLSARFDGLHIKRRMAVARDWKD
jgi:hypothetical protein